MSAEKPHAPRCTAKSKGTGERCRQPAVPGRTTCHYHGGNTPIGIASPHYKHGRYSKLPAAMHAGYLESKADPNFLSVAEELHALRGLAANLVDGLDGDVVAVRRDVSAAWDGVRAARASGDIGRIQAAMAALDTAMTTAAGVNGKLGEILVTFDAIRKLSEAETKRTVMAKEMLTREQAQQFSHLVQAAVVDAITSALTNPNDRQAVLAAFTNNMLLAQVGGLG